MVHKIAGMAEDEKSHKIAAWKKSHSSYIQFLRSIKSPESGPVSQSVVSRVQSVSLSVQDEEETAVAVVETAVPRYQVYSVKKPTQVFREGGWTSRINPRQKTRGKVNVRSYNLTNYSNKGGNRSKGKL